MSKERPEAVEVGCPRSLHRHGCHCTAQACDCSGCLALVDWAKWLPPAPLPDTGPKEFKVGQVWAWRVDYGIDKANREVIRILDVNAAGRATTHSLAKDGVHKHTGGIDPDSFAARESVLLQDVGEPHPRPVEEVYGEGFVHLGKRGVPACGRKYARGTASTTLADVTCEKCREVRKKWESEPVLPRIGETWRYGTLPPVTFTGVGERCSLTKDCDEHPHLILLGAGMADQYCPVGVAGAWQKIRDWGGRR